MQSKNWIGNLLKMNYLEFSFCENEIPASVKVCMAAAAAAWLTPLKLQIIYLNGNRMEKIRTKRSDMFVLRKTLEDF